MINTVKTLYERKIVKNVIDLMQSAYILPSSLYIGEDSLIKGRWILYRDLIKVIFFDEDDDVCLAKDKAVELGFNPYEKIYYGFCITDEYPR